MAGTQFGQERVTMCGCGNDEPGLSKRKAFAEKISDRAAQRRFALVETDGVKVSRRFGRIGVPWIHGVVSITAPHPSVAGQFAAMHVAAELNARTRCRAECIQFIER